MTETLPEPKTIRRVLLNAGFNYNGEGVEPNVDEALERIDKMIAQLGYNIQDSWMYISGDDRIDAYLKALSDVRMLLKATE